MIFSILLKFNYLLDVQYLVCLCVCCAEAVRDILPRLINTTGGKSVKWKITAPIFIG